MPRASERTAMLVKSGAWARVRTARRTSRMYLRRSSGREGLLASRRVQPALMSRTGRCYDRYRSGLSHERSPRPDNVPSHARPGRPGLRACPSRDRARPRTPLSRRVRGRPPPVSRALRRARARARAEGPRRENVLGGAVFLLPRLFGRPASARGVDRGGRGRARRPRPAAAGASARRDAHLVTPLGSLPVDRQHRGHVLRLRLGVAPLRGGLPRDLPRQRRDGSALAGPPRLPMARLPRRVRGWPHQAAGRSVLAPPHLHGMASRDTAHAEPAELVLPPPPAPDPSHGGRRQLRRPAPPPFRARPPAAAGVRRGPPP